MKKIKINNEYYKSDNKIVEVEQIVKTSNSIIGIVNGQEVFKFNGISNFSIFSLDEGIEWDKDTEEVKNNTLAQLTLENVDLKQQVEMLSKTVASMQLGGM